MSRRLIVDASVVVKWLSHDAEPALGQAHALLEAAVTGDMVLISSDLVMYETLNALVRGKQLLGRTLALAVETLWDLPLARAPLTHRRARLASRLSAEFGLTVYDAIYVALAMEFRIPLVTANIRHQGKVPLATVIDIADWHYPA